MAKTVALIMLLLGSVPQGGRPTSSVDAAFSVFHAEMRLESRRAAAMGSDTRQRRMARESFERLFRWRISVQEIKNLNSGDLDLIFRAAEEAVTFSLEPRYALDMHQIVKALASKGDATPGHYERTYSAFVAVRDFDRALALAAEYRTGNFEELPEAGRTFNRTGKPSVWGVNRANRIALRRIRISGDLSIIAVSHPMCHFSTNAASDISSDELLAPIFKSHSVWITPQAGKLYLSEIESWNRKYVGMPIAPVVRQSDWPVIDYWATPAFFFVRDGRVVEKVIGWPKEGRREELLAASRKLGLLPHSPSNPSGAAKIENAQE